MLNKHQKQFLKGYANGLKATVTVGKSDLTDTILDSVDEVLTAHEIVKISLLQTVESTVDEIAIEVASETHSEIISIVGRKIVLYRANPKNPKIVLPK